jgi:hypothetical protein
VSRSEGSATTPSRGGRGSASSSPPEVSLPSLSPDAVPVSPALTLHVTLSTGGV